jgi:hypothetical protein
VGEMWTPQVLVRIVGSVATVALSVKKEQALPPVASSPVPVVWAAHQVTQLKGFQRLAELVLVASNGQLGNLWASAVAGTRIPWVSGDAVL